MKTVAGLSLMSMLLVGAGPGGAAGHAGGMPATTQLRVAFPSQVYINTGALAELVDFTGEIHMVIVPPDPVQPTDPVQPQDPIHVYTNLAGVVGVGQTTGAIYRVTGAAQSSFVKMLPASLEFHEGYRLVPPDPVSPQPLLLRYTVDINADGIVGEVFVTMGET